MEILFSRPKVKIAKLKGVRVNFLSSYPISLDDLEKQIGLTRIRHHDIDLHINGWGKFDIVIVANYPRVPAVVFCEQAWIFKLVQEPVLPGFWFRFTRKHNRKISNIYGIPFAQGGKGPGFLPWHLDKSYDDLMVMNPPHKTKAISAIASRKMDLPGHIWRTKFIDSVESECPEVEVFGFGREKELKTKGEGLRDYVKTLAIENTEQENYFTEKFMDPILLWTFPVYVGAPNLNQFFSGANAFLKAGAEFRNRETSGCNQTLSPDLTSQEKELLNDVREAVLNTYSLGSFIVSRVEEYKNENAPTKRKAIMLFELSTFAHFLRDIAGRTAIFFSRRI
jgi:hypothetical protein